MPLTQTPEVLEPAVAPAEVDVTRLCELPEFDDHALVSFAQDKETGLKAVIAVHRVNPVVPSFGATRLWHYASTMDGVRDALRLGRLMSYKAALAGLECGGAKGVIIAETDPHTLSPEDRRKLLNAYAARVNALGGRFVTGTDVGVSQEDLSVMKRACPSIIGFNNNSTEFTAIGVYESVKASLEEAFGSSDPAGHSFAIQGLGKVGNGLLELLYEPAGASAKIYVADIDPAQVEKIRAKYPRVIPVAPEAIAEQDVDVFSPCALSGVINAESIPRIKARVVAGGANNQLATEADGDALFARGIVYAPDYVANAGGLIAVFDEYKNPTYERSRVERSVMHIPGTLKKIFAESRARGEAPARVANLLAEKIFNAYGRS